MAAISPINRDFLRAAYDVVDEKVLGGRTITQYLIRSGEHREAAVQAITQLLESNPSLCPIFENTSERIRDLVVRNHYLVINHEAVVFTSTRETTHAEFKDKSFSLGLLREPVRCSQGHWLERSFLPFWVAKKGRVCPRGEHPIGDTAVDEELQADIQVLREAEERKRLVTSCSNVIIEAQRVRQEALAQLSSQSLDYVAAGGGVGKLVFKLGAKPTVKAAKPLIKWALTLAAKEAPKMVAKEAPKIVAKELPQLLAKEAPKVAVKAKVVSKGIIKKLPVVSLFIGIAFGVYRFYKGEIAKGCIEIISGGVACIPVWGTAASITIDLGLLGHDVYEEHSAKRKHRQLEEQNLEFAIDPYGVFELPNTETLTREEVDRAWRSAHAQLHPDKLAYLGPFIQAHVQDLMIITNGARDRIYQERGWS